MAEPPIDAQALTLVVSGALAMGYAVAALFFARFRRRTGAPVFGWMAVAFALLAVQRLLLVPAVRSGREPVWLYGLRLLAFVLILFGIWSQNRPRRAR